MSGAVSPAGDQHPGTIAYEDQVEGRQWTRPAAEVPQSVAWVDVNGVWQPVVRIVSTGTADQREIAKFGVDGGLLEITVQSPPPPRPPAAPEPMPQPAPEPPPRSD